MPCFFSLGSIDQRIALTVDPWQGSSLPLHVMKDNMWGWISSAKNVVGATLPRWISGLGSLQKSLASSLAASSGLHLDEVTTSFLHCISGVI